MDDTSKYLIHAAITADGVVERSDVVGAIFGQTEGLLGSDLDLRDLQQSSKIGRIDVEIRSEGGRSFGEITIASSLDRVETAILAASLETLTRVGPCRGRVEVTDIQDVREAKRRQVVERAKELLDEAFDEGVLSSDDVLEEVREAVRAETIAEYEGLPAGPRVADSDAVVVVEGRADVLTLLDHGIKNAVAVEGTDVPSAVADLTGDRTVTAFLDGDRGGELILRELAQVGHVDHVAFAPDGRSVEDLDREAVMAALRDKVPYERLPDPDDGDGTLRSAVVGDGGASAVEPSASVADHDAPATPDESGAVADDAAGGTADTSAASSEEDEESAAVDGSDGHEASRGADSAASSDASEVATPSLATHVRDVIGAGTGRARLLDADLATLAEVDADEAFDAIEESTDAFAVVLDDELSQRVLDVAAQRGVEHVVAGSTGEFVKRPVDVRVRTADQIDA